MNPRQLSRETRLQLARDPNADAETLRAAYYLRDDEICLAIAKHPNASAVTLGSLAYSGNDRIREAVARHRNTSDLHLAKLASDCCSAIVEAVARRKDISPHVLALLAAQPFDLFKGCQDGEDNFDERDLTRYWYIGCALADNPSTPKSALTKFWRAHARGKRWNWTGTILRMRRAFRKLYPAASPS